MVINMPGNINNHHAVSISREPSEIKTPQDVNGSWTPKPRKDKKLSKMITDGTIRVI